MPIAKHVEGDLLKAEENVIGHQVNCQGVMGSGVAAQVKQKFPEAFTMYRDLVSSHVGPTSDLLGDCQLVSDPRTGKILANLFGQDNYGLGEKHTSETALRRAMEYLNSFCEERGLSVALPYKLGSDRGGANWSDILQIIEEVFVSVPVTIYQFSPR